MYLVTLTQEQYEQVKSVLVDNGISVYVMTLLPDLSMEMIEEFQAKLERIRRQHFPESRAISRQDAARVLRWAGGDPDHPAIAALIALSRWYQAERGHPLPSLGANLVKLIRDRAPHAIIRWAEKVTKGTFARRSGTAKPKASTSTSPSWAPSPMYERLRRVAAAKGIATGSDEEPNAADEA